MRRPAHVLAIISMLFAGLAATGSAAAAPPPPPALLSTVAIRSSPQAVVVDSRSDRVFVAGNSAGANTSGTVTMLDARTGKLLRTITISSVPIVGPGPESLAVDTRTNHLIVGYGTGARVLNATTGSLLETMSFGPNGPSRAVAVDEATSRAFLVDNTASRAGVLNTASGRFLGAVALDSSPISVVADEPTGRVFVTAGTVLDVLDARRGTLLTKVTLCPGLDYCSQYPLAVDPHAGRLFSLVEGMLMLDGTTGAIKRRIKVATMLDALAVDPGTGHVFVASHTLDGKQEHASVFDPHTGKFLRSDVIWQGAASAGYTARAVAVDSSTHRVFVVSARPVGTGRVVILNATNGAPRSTITVGRQPSGIAVDEQTHRAFVINSQDGTVSVLDTH